MLLHMELLLPYVGLAIVFLALFQGITRFRHSGNPWIVALKTAPIGCTASVLALLLTGLIIKQIPQDDTILPSMIYMVVTLSTAIVVSLASGLAAIYYAIGLLVPVQRRSRDQYPVSVLMYFTVGMCGMFIQGALFID